MIAGSPRMLSPTNPTNTITNSNISKGNIYISHLYHIFIPHRIKNKVSDWRIVEGAAIVFHNQTPNVIGVLIIVQSDYNGPKWGPYIIVLD